MSCCGGKNQLQGKQFCQTCMPDESHWLVPVDQAPDPFFMDRHHAYITPDNKIYVLDQTGTKTVQVSGSAGGANYKAGNGITISNGDTIHAQVTNADVDRVGRDALNALAKAEQALAKPDNDTRYTAGTGITISPTNQITVDDSALRRRIEALEGRADKFVRSVTQSRNGNTVTLTYNMSDGTNQTVNFEDKDTVNLAYNDAELKRRIDALERKPDNNTTYTAGTGITINGTNQISATPYNDADIKRRLSALEARPIANNVTVNTDHLATNQRVDELRGGIRNLITETCDMQVHRLGDRNGTVTKNNFGEIEIKDTVSTSNNWLGNGWNLDEPITQGQQYVLRVPLYIDNSVPIDAGAGIEIKSHNPQSSVITWWLNDLPKNQWVIFEKVFVADKTLANTEDSLYIRLVQKGYIKVGRPILAKGNIIPGDHTLSPNDPCIKNKEYKAGNGITISADGTISSTFTPTQAYNDAELKRRITALEGRADNNTTYSAGNGLTLGGTQFSVNTNVIATKASVDGLTGRVTALENDQTNDFIMYDTTNQRKTNAELDTYANQKGYNHPLTADQYREVKVGSTLAWAYTNADTGKKDIVYYIVKSKGANNTVTIDGIGRTYSDPSHVGKNIFPNSSFIRPFDNGQHSTGHLRGNLTATIDTGTQFYKYNTLKISNVRPYTDDSRYIVTTPDYPKGAKAWSNQNIRLSFWAKADRNYTAHVNAGARSQIPINLTTDWKFYDIQLVSSHANDAWAEVAFFAKTAGTYWVASPKVEEGTSSTPYTIDCGTINHAFRAGNNISIDENGVISANIPAPTPAYNDADIKRRLDALERKPDNNTTYTAGTGIEIVGNQIRIKDADVATQAELRQVQTMLDNANNIIMQLNNKALLLDKIIDNLKASGAWVNNGFAPGRNIATGNINLFGGTQDGNSFIRTNNGRTENDLTGGI